MPQGLRHTGSGRSAVTRLAGGARHLIYEALAAATIADASQSNVEIFIAAVHRVRSWECLKWGNAEMRPEKSYLSLARGPRGDRSPRREPSHVNGLAPCGGAPFISPSRGRVLAAVMSHRQTCELMR